MILIAAVAMVGCADRVTRTYSSTTTTVAEPAPAPVVRERTVIVPDDDVDPTTTKRVEERVYVQ
jgi:hypothetical protein